jgi:hypothetical protein
MSMLKGREREFSLARIACHPELDSGSVELTA